MRSIFFTTLVIPAAIAALVQPPTTDQSRDQSPDQSMNSILGFSKAAPATQPDITTQPVANSPLKNQAEDDQSRPGILTLSDGTVIKGKIATTTDKPIRVWVEKEKDYEDVPFSMLDTAEVNLIWERDEKEWNFKETGSDVKVYSGRTYPARQTQYKFTLNDGTLIEGDVVAPLYVTTDDGKTKTYVLYKRDKGDIGQTLAQRVYVKSVKLAK